MSESKNSSSAATFSQSSLSAYTQDGKLQKFKPDVVVRELTVEQFEQWKKGIEEHDAKYFYSQTIGVAMTKEQHEEIDTFIKTTFAQLNEENNFEHESVSIEFSTHFINQIRSRKRKKINTSIMHREVLRKFVAEFNSVDGSFRWGKSGSTGISYRLFNQLNEKKESRVEEVVSIAIYPHDGDSKITMEINMVTYFLKRRKKKKK